MSRTRQNAEIMEVMDRYVRGTRTSDAALLRSVFHPSALVAGYREDALLIRDPEGFIERAATNAAGDDYVASVSGIALFGNTAVATMFEDNLWGMSFVNNFHLIRQPSGEWIITAKLFHHD